MVYRHLNDCIDFLNDSKIVFKVQKYFGIEVLHQQHKSPQTQNRTIDGDVKHDQHKYRINNRFFYVFFSFVTQLGSESFYIMFIPLLAWLYDVRLTSLMCLSWAVNMYLGQVTKEIFCMPRPSTPPVVKLDKKYIDEYGFPSTHAMAAMSISFTVLTLLFNSNDQIQFKYPMIVSASILCVMIGLSRIYLGMHSLLDVIGGLVYSYVISSLFVPYTSSIDQLLANGLLYGIGFYFIGLLLCLVYPKANRDSTARTDTMIIIGVASGICLATSLKYTLQISQPPFYTKLFVAKHVHLTLLRILIGCAATFLTRLICKKAIFIIALNFFNFKKYFARNELHDVKTLLKRKYSFEVVFYFLTYSCVSFTVFFTAFMLFNIVSI